MAGRIHNIVLGLILLTLSGVWIWLVVDTIPKGFGGGDIGPRVFPLMFGIILAVLSALLLLKTLLARSDTQASDGNFDGYMFAIRWLPAALVLIEIASYGFLLKTFGFVIATPIVVLFVMLVNLRIVSPKLLLGMSLGVTASCWLIFEKALGIYLANGSWINLG
ncbi:MAG: putative tricarboxylic transport membrane protein [Alteromonas macleodii]|jgi:putative tricarboxylic transport membrane protein